MATVVALATGFLATRLLWILLYSTFSAPVFTRLNYRDAEVPTAVGAVLPVALVCVEGGRAIIGALGVGDHYVLSDTRGLVVVAAIGFGLLGAIDDLGGEGDARGFRGHIAALLEGRLTTGGLKLAGGAAVALMVCGPLSGTSATGLLRDAALVALCANLGNLFDRRPGRALKVATVAYLPLVILASSRGRLLDVAVIVGGGLGLLLDDLHERLMLGDAGANVLGGVLGLGVVLAYPPNVRAVVLMVVAGLNLVSEVVSFTRVIEAVAPLRALDRWGTR